MNTIDGPEEQGLVAASLPTQPRQDSLLGDADAGDNISLLTHEEEEIIDQHSGDGDERVASSTIALIPRLLRWGAPSARRSGNSRGESQRSNSRGRAVNVMLLLRKPSGGGGSDATLLSRTTPRTNNSGSAVDAEGGQRNAGRNKRPSLDRRPSPSPNPPHPSRWVHVQQFVNSGDVLLQTSLLGGPNQYRSLEDSSEDAAQDRQSRRELAQERIRNKMTFTLTHCLLAIFCYIAIAVMAFSFLFDEKWTVIDSMYYAVVIFSSCGYGDLTPNTHAARAFTAVFTLSSIACLGVALGVLGNQLVEAQQSALERAKSLSERHVVTLFAPPTASATAATAVPCTDNPKSTPQSERSAPGLPAALTPRNLSNTEERPTPEWMHVAQEFAVVVGVLVLFAVVIMWVDPAITLDNVAYFLIITSTTTGLGDVTPVSQAGRLVTALLIPLAVAAMGRWLSITAAWITDTRQRHVRRFLEAKDLTYEDLEVMDEDGDGNVTRAEFLEFMLVAMDKVDRSLIEELRRQFANLDVDGTGILSRGDLIALARRKLQDPVRKLELARYKEQLLQQAHAGRSPEPTRTTRGRRWTVNALFSSFQPK